MPLTRDDTIFLFLSAEFFDHLTSPAYRVELDRRLRSIGEMSSEEFANGDPSIDYAQSRYFCLYLQQGNLLESFYRRCRAHHAVDRDGLQSLCELMATDDLRAIDTKFETWSRTH